MLAARFNKEFPAAVLAQVDAELICVFPAVDLFAPECFFRCERRKLAVVACGKSRPSPSSRREVLVDYRPNAGIRIAPHFYTSDDELDRPMAELRSVSKPLFAVIHSCNGIAGPVF